MWFPLYYLLFLAASVVGSPLHSINEKREVTPLSDIEFADFISFIEFARAAYCTPAELVGWKCGEYISRTSLCLRMLFSYCPKTLALPFLILCLR
jgi:hypothetical protein